MDLGSENKLLLHGLRRGNCADSMTFSRARAQARSQNARLRQSIRFRDAVSDIAMTWLLAFLAVFELEALSPLPR